MRHRPRPLHRTVRGSARQTGVWSPSRHHSIFPRPPRPTSHGGPRMATAPRTRPLGHVGRVGPCAAPPPAESDVAYVALPPRAPPSDAFPRPNTGQRGARAADGHVLVQWCWSLETPRRPGVVRVRIWTGEQRHGLMAGWTDSTERGGAGRAAAVPCALHAALPAFPHSSACAVRRPHSAALRIRLLCSAPHPMLPPARAVPSHSRR